MKSAVTKNNGITRVTYSNDYKNDTTMLIDGNLIVLTYASEDEDCGTEVAHFTRETLGQVMRLVSKASEIPDPLYGFTGRIKEIHESYTRSSLIAWHNMFEDCKSALFSKPEVLYGSQISCFAEEIFDLTWNLADHVSSKWVDKDFDSRDLFWKVFNTANIFHQTFYAEEDDYLEAIDEAAEDMIQDLDEQMK